MDSTLWRRWSALERIAARPGRVAAWTEIRAWSPDDPGHLSPNPTAVVCLEGVVRVQRPGERLDLRPGDVLLLGPGVWHEHVPPRRGSAWFGQGFLMTWSDWVMLDADGVHAGRLPLQPTRNLVEAALAASAAERPAAAAAWLGQLVRERFEPLAPRRSPVEAMAGTMYRRLCSGVTADDLVRVSGLGRAAAFKAFTAWYGMTPGRAIRHCRLTLAAAYLAQGMGVAESARRSGFAVSDSFSRAWRRAHGAAPAAGRRGG